MRAGCLRIQTREAGNLLKKQSRNLIHRTRRWADEKMVRTLRAKSLFQIVHGSDFCGFLEGRRRAQRRTFWALAAMTKKRIKHALRKIISAFPGGNILLRKRENFLEGRRIARLGNAKEVFRHYYEVNEWGSEESVSGPGSTIQYTENIRKMIPQLVSDLGSLVILDAPCGDYNWFRMIDWETQITYIGGDIVEALVERNQSNYGNSNTKFINLDIVNDVLPRADLWLCRDCLFHLSYPNILSVINNFLNSDIGYILTSTHPNCKKNIDIPTGSFRLLNLELPPFSFGKPIQAIDDWIEGYPVRRLALWEREALWRNLAANKAFQRTAKRRR